MASTEGDPADVARRLSTEVANLRIALETRTCIGQAQGILMEREHITPEAAFDRLRGLSQDENRKLHDVAQDLIDSTPNDG